MSHKTPYTIDPVLTGLSLAYKNAEFIADKVLPRVNVGGVQYKWWKWDFGQFITVPDTKIGRKSAPNEVEFNATELPGATNDYGLSDAVPVTDSERRPPNQPDPMRVATVGTTNLVLLDREKRVSDLVLNAANYAAANKATLSGTSQWSDPASDPVNAILSALDGLVMRPNKAVIGRAVFTKLRQHAKIIAAALPNGGNAAQGGIASLRSIADLLELDEIIVGSSWINTAEKGQAATLARVWGKDALFYYDSPVVLQAGAVSEATPTFGWTAQAEDRQVQTYFDPKPGVKGVNTVKVVEQLGENLCAPDLAYLFKAAVA
jgi:hypothetical protein